MKIKNYVKEVREEIKQDRIGEAKTFLKERLLEIESAEKVLANMKKQLTELLEEEIDSLE